MPDGQRKYLGSNIFSFGEVEVPAPELTVKATGQQWYWNYEYVDQGKTRLDSHHPAPKTTAPGRRRRAAAAPARRRQRAGRSGQHHRARAGHRRSDGRDPRLRRAVLRHQDRRRAGPAQRDLVQRPQDRHLLRPVLRALRQGPRLHADRRARRDQGSSSPPGWQRSRRASSTTPTPPCRRSAKNGARPTQRPTEDKGIASNGRHSRSGSPCMATATPRRTIMVIRPAGGATSIRPTTRTSARCTSSSRSSRG